LIAKSIFSVVAFLFILAVVASLAGSIVLQSQSGKKCLEKALSGICNLPVSVRSSYALPPNTIRLSGVTAGLPGEPPLFTGDSILLKPELMALLRGQFLIASITLNKPSLQLRSHAMGVMKSAKNPTQPSAGLATTQPNQIDSPIPSSTTTFNSSSSSLNTPLSGSVPIRDRSLKLPSSLKKLTISDGKFSLLDAQGMPLLGVEGIELHTMIPGETVQGIIKASRVIYENRFIFHNLSSPFSFSAPRDSLSLDPLETIFGGGKLVGKALFDFTSSSPDYSLSLKLTGATLGDLLAGVSMDGANTEGSVSGSLDLSGLMGQGASMSGKGNLACTGAIIQPLGFLRQIGQLLQVEELQLLKIAEGKCLFRIDDGRIVIDDLMLRSENLILSARGPLLPSGELDLDSRLLFNEKLTGRLKGLLGPQLSPAAETGYSQLAFHVSGTAMNPKTDLLERITGLRIGGDLGGLLQGLFGHPSPRVQSTPSSGSSTH